VKVPRVLVDLETAQSILLEIGIVTGIVGLLATGWKGYHTVRHQGEVAVEERERIRAEFIERDRLMAKTLEDVSHQLKIVRRDINGEGLGGQLKVQAAKIDHIDAGLIQLRTLMSASIAERDEIMRMTAIDRALWGEAIRACVPDFRPPPPLYMHPDDRPRDRSGLRET
jgi:hypothetical protein